MGIFPSIFFEKQMRPEFVDCFIVEVTRWVNVGHCCQLFPVTRPDKLRFQSNFRKFRPSFRGHCSIAHSKSFPTRSIIHLSRNLYFIIELFPLSLSLLWLKIQFFKYSLTGKNIVFERSKIFKGKFKTRFKTQICSLVIRNIIAFGKFKANLVTDVYFIQNSISWNPEIKLNVIVRPPEYLCEIKYLRIRLNRNRI